MIPRYILNTRTISKEEGNSSIVVQGYDGRKIRVLGSSEPISSIDRQTGSFTVTPHDKKGVIAIEIYTENENGKRTTQCGFFLEISCNDGKAEIELDKQWAPSYLARIIDHYVEIDIDKICFSNNKNALGEPGTKVADGSTICKYLAGQITYKELNKRADELQKKKIVSNHARKSLFDCIKKTVAYSLKKLSCTA